jgi:hypothetical protein
MSDESTSTTPTWKSFVNAYQQLCPNKSFKDCLQEASPLWQNFKTQMFGGDNQTNETINEDIEQGMGAFGALDYDTDEEDDADIEDRDLTGPDPYETESALYMTVDDYMTGGGETVIDVPHLHRAYIGQLIKAMPKFREGLRGVNIRFNDNDPEKSSDYTTGEIRIITANTKDQETVIDRINSFLADLEAQAAQRAEKSIKRAPMVSVKVPKMGRSYIARIIRELQAFQGRIGRGRITYVESESGPKFSKGVIEIDAPAELLGALEADITDFVVSVLEQARPEKAAEYRRARGEAAAPAAPRKASPRKESPTRRASPRKESPRKVSPRKEYPKKGRADSAWEED